MDRNTQIASSPLCLLCGAPSVTVGVYAPRDAAGVSAVLTLRCAPITASMPGIAYGVCAVHADAPDLLERAEKVIIAIAQRVRTQ